MRVGFLAVLALAFASPCVSAAARCTSYTPAYASAVSEGHTDVALKILYGDLGWSADDQKSIVITPGLAEHNGNRNAQADPDTFHIDVDPGLLAEGQVEGCEDLVHEMTHLRHFFRDHQALVTYFATASSTTVTTGWKNCDEDPGPKATAALRTSSAFDCLMDNDLIPHAAAYEIEAVLAQTLVIEGPLRKEDEDYLADYMNRFDKSWRTLVNPKNESYYLPSMKAEDRTIYCDGAHYLNRVRHDAYWMNHCPSDDKPLLFSPSKAL